MQKGTKNNHKVYQGSPRSVTKPEISDPCEMLCSQGGEKLNDKGRAFLQITGTDQPDYTVSHGRMQ
jgi:hypothetical protein